MKLTNNKQTLVGTVGIPFHGVQGPQGKSAYDIACENGFVGSEKEWLSLLGLPDGVLIANGWVWYPSEDKLQDPDSGKIYSLKDFEHPSNSGKVITVCGDGTEVAFNTDKYTIVGSNGFLNVGDCIALLDGRWVRINLYEAKASTVKNSDGKYSPKSGVDGLFSSTQAAYLTDLIDAYWNTDKLTVFHPVADGHMVNWCRDTGIYVGGFKPNCGGHPPVLNNNQTSWLLMVFNGMSMSETDTSYNHRLQIAVDLANSRIYIRRGWISTNEWTDWIDSAETPDGSITQDKLSSALKQQISERNNSIAALTKQLNGITFAVDESGHLTAEIA